MQNFDKDKYNEITYHLIHALLFKVTDALLAVFVESKERKVNVKIYLDTDKISDFDGKLITDFEAELRERLPDFEIELVVKKLLFNEFVNSNASQSYFNEESFGTYIFQRFNEILW